MPKLRLRAALAATCCPLALLVACSRAPSEQPAVFGGKGAQVELNEKPLPAGAGEAPALGPCGEHAPISDAALIDDFEDGNDRIFKVFGRDGFWFAAGDHSEGSSVTPSGGFAAELLPSAESTKDNRYAAHFAAAGQKQWGVVFGSALNWTEKGIKCPLNVAGFAGVRFRAKGPGKVRFSVAVPEVVPKDGGGNCTDGCYDAHGKLFLLSDGWDSYEARWEKLQQGGWGAEARFTPERVVNLAFNVDVKSLPIDFWIDDLELIPKAPATAAPAH